VISPVALEELERSEAGFEGFSGAPVSKLIEVGFGGFAGASAEAAEVGLGGLSCAESCTWAPIDLGFEGLSGLGGADACESVALDSCSPHGASLPFNNSLPRCKVSEKVCAARSKDPFAEEIELSQKSDVFPFLGMFFILERSWTGPEQIGASPARLSSSLRE
jgi:hypothetical protein